MFVTDATNLPRVMNCNGSRNMPASFPPAMIDQTSRDEGTAAHWLAQQWFNSQIDPNQATGVKAPNGVIITGEMVDHVGAYLLELSPGRMEDDTTFGGGTWQVRARCDHWSWDETTATLTIDDFKYGRSLVMPDENWTLIAHACGVFERYQIFPQRVVLRIHQPRAYHPDGPLRSWSIDFEMLRQYHLTINDTLSNLTDTLRTGFAWCGKCHALATCPAARAARMNIIDMTAHTFTDQMPNDALAYELDTITTATKFLEAQLDALQELAKYRLQSGQVIERNGDQYALEPQYANTRWKPGFDPETLSMVAKVDCTKTTFITPAEAKRRGVNETAIKALTERPLVGNKLVRVSADKRAKRLLKKET